MKRISNYALDCFTLKVMAIAKTKNWGTEHFRRVIICAGNRMSVEETAKEIDSINA